MIESLHDNRLTDPNLSLKRDRKTGIARVEDRNCGLSYGPHANIDQSGSVQGMKAKGWWNKKARTARAFGFIYNIDTLSTPAEKPFALVAADHCCCVACSERRDKERS